MHKKLNLKPDQATGVSLPNIHSEIPAKGSIPKGLRRLKWDEVVSQGDFVINEQLEYQPWEGPGGFRASSFLKPIYRQAPSRSKASK